ncbi:hypothetical protein [Amycolatopsis sp. NPDC059021]|uniref:hypothetical protein n=1 Tax=Amycolatopsis sp. NPDC059021 TaxID=3346704 RepID=UPI003670B80C
MNVSLRTDPFTVIAARLRMAADTFAGLATAADHVATEAPKYLAGVPVKGVRRPVEDVVTAREDSGIYAALDAVRRHATQAVLHAETASAFTRRAADAFDRPAEQLRRVVENSPNQPKSTQGQT